MTFNRNQKTRHQKLLLGALIIFSICAFAAYERNFFNWEQSIFFAIYNLPRFLRLFFWLITQLGSAWMLVIIAIYLLIGKAASQVWGRRVIINGAVTYVLVEIAKNVVARSRPDVFLSIVKQKGLFVLHGYGFPSGHTAMATVVSLTIMPYLPRKWRWLPWVWIPLVALSRIYLGVHAPLDVVGGFAIGLSVYCISRLLETPQQ